MPEVMTNLNKEDGVSDYYEVRPLNLNDKKAKKEALRELQVLQTRCLADYKTWAKEYVKYQDFGKGKNVDVKLKQCNDQYTMSILMSCIGPLREGISFSSVFTSYLTYNMAKMSNPNMDEDMSRLLLNFRDGLMSASETSDGLSKTVIDKLLKHTDKFVLESSADLMNNNIANNLRTHELDSLVMSPRQLAVLKLNFIEQFYVDSRSLGDLSKIENRDKYLELQDSYKAAVRHIEAIANNSGYNMDVVAVEERYLVGLKMSTNPEYANIFNETKEAFGIVPEYDDGDGKIWSGRFKTADGHNFTTGGAKVGTFTPRVPYGLSFTTDSYDESAIQIQNEALDDQIQKVSRLFISATMYVDSDNLDLSKSEKAQIKKGIEEASERYKNQLYVQFKEDGVFKGDEKQIKAYIDDRFPDLEKSDFYRAELAENNVYKQFDGNVSYVVEKEILNSMRDAMIDKCRIGTIGSIRGSKQGMSDEDEELYMDIIDLTRAKGGQENITSRQDIPDDIAKAYLALRAHKRSELMDVRDNRTPDDVLKDSVANYIEGMTNEERVDLILHTCSNMLSIKPEDDFQPPKYTIWTTEEERKARRGDPDISEDEAEESSSQDVDDKELPDVPDESSDDKEDDGPDV